MGFIEQNLEWIISIIVVPVAVWFASKRHFQERELKSKDIENTASQVSVVGQNLDLYQRMLDDVEARTNAKIQRLEEEIIFLEDKNKELRLRLSKLENR